MNIAQIVCVYPPYKGGIGNSVYNLKKALCERGYRVDVLTPRYRQYENQDKGIKKINPLARTGNAAFIPQIFFMLSNYDIVHLHLPFLGATLPTLFYFLFHSKKKLFLTYHMDLKSAGVKGFIFKIYKKFILPLALKRADKIFISSFDYANNCDIKKYFNKYKEKFIEAPFWVDEKIFFKGPKDEEILARHGLMVTDRILLFVGGLDKAHYFKGVPILLRALKVVREDGMDIRLIIVGDGDMKAEYIDMANVLGIADIVSFAGEVSDSDLPKYYRSADVFVLPSTDASEAFGLVLLEAKLCGLPIIASALHGVRTLVNDGEDGFLTKAEDSDDLAKKIIQLFNSDIKGFGKRAEARAKQNYTKRIILEKIIKVYDS